MNYDKDKWDYSTGNDKIELQYGEGALYWVLIDDGIITWTIGMYRYGDWYVAGPYAESFNTADFKKIGSRITVPNDTK